MEEHEAIGSEDDGHDYEPPALERIGSVSEVTAGTTTTDGFSSVKDTGG